jgi:hypothetical protein
MKLCAQEKKPAFLPCGGDAMLQYLCKIRWPDVEEVSFCRTLRVSVIRRLQIVAEFERTKDV